MDNKFFYKKTYCTFKIGYKKFYLFKRDNYGFSVHVKIYDEKSKSTVLYKNIKYSKYDNFGKISQESLNVVYNFVGKKSTYKPGSFQNSFKNYNGCENEIVRNYDV